MWWGSSYVHHYKPVSPPFTCDSPKKYRHTFWEIHHVFFNFYRPQHSCDKVMFSQASVILYTGGGGVWQTPPGRHPSGRHPPGQTSPGRRPPRQTRPLSRHPPQVDTLLPSACWDTHPLPSAWWDIPPPPVATAADVTHPTGMHSCLTFCIHKYRSEIPVWSIPDLTISYLNFFWQNQGMYKIYVFRYQFA